MNVTDRDGSPTMVGSAPSIWGRLPMPSSPSRMRSSSVAAAVGSRLLVDSVGLGVGLTYAPQMKGHLDEHPRGRSRRDAVRDLTVRGQQRYRLAPTRALQRRGSTDV